jgi:hypothetical protein
VGNRRRLGAVFEQGALPLSVVEAIQESSCGLDALGGFVGKVLASVIGASDQLAWESGSFEDFRSRAKGGWGCLEEVVVFWRDVRVGQRGHGIG